MKKYFLLLLTLLLLPTLLAAQERVVQLPHCTEGSAFTIRIPVRFPDDMTVTYEWYCNDTLIAGTLGTLSAYDNKISYTIPASKAHGTAVYHFEYCLLDDDCRKWTRSPKFVVAFATPPVEWCNGITSAGSIDDDACTGVTSAGSISDGACTGVTSAGSISDGACTGITSAGRIKW